MQRDAPLPQQAAWDQLWAELIATRILCMQQWGFLMAAQTDPKAWKERQRKMAHQSVDVWSFEGHPNVTGFKAQIRAAIDSALATLIQGRTEGDPLQ